MNTCTVKFTKKGWNVPEASRRPFAFTHRATAVRYALALEQIRNR